MTTDEPTRIANELLAAHRDGFLDGADDPLAGILASAIHVFRASVLTY